MALSKKQKSLYVVIPLVLLQAVLGPITLRDLARRTDDEVRGPRLLWRLWGATNLAGVAGYWAVGRKRPTGAHV